MKKNILLFLFAFIFTIFSTAAQNYAKGTITTTSNKTIEGRVLIDYETQKIYLKKDLKTTNYTFNQVNSIIIRDTPLSKKTFDNAIYFASTITSGKGNLYKINDSQYLITGNNGKNAIFNTNEKSSKTPGILSILFDDCNTIRAIINREDNFNKSVLLKIVEAYNTCDYSTYAPTDKEIKNATKHNTDQASFYAGIGTGLNNISFFESSDTEALSSIQLQAGVIASPSFFGRIQGNLFVSLEGTANFSGEKDFGNNGTDATSFRVNSYRAFIGLEYLFNKTGKIKPFLGISAGATSDSFEGVVRDINFNITGGNPIYVPKIGARLQLANEKHIGLTISYISEYENDLSFRVNNTVIPLIVNNENFTLSLNYYF